VKATDPASSIDKSFPARTALPRDRRRVLEGPTKGGSKRRGHGMREKGESIVPLVRRIIGCLLLAYGIFAAAWPACAQGKLEARYHATLAGVQIGRGNWIVEIGQTHYDAATSGVTTGLMHVLTHGEGTSAVHGTLRAGRPVKSIYASTIKSRAQRDEVRVTIDNGNVKDFRTDPPPNDRQHRVPITEEERRGVLDPLTASLLHAPGTGSALAPATCERTLPIFDGRLRYDLELGFKRMDKVKAEEGYAGPVLVCSVRFVPLGGFVPSHRTIKYLAKLKDIEVWLAPVAGTRVLVPFRMQGPTPIGEAVLEAVKFVTVATPSHATVEGAKLR
jgi:hypothetical protein